MKVFFVATPKGLDKYAQNYKRIAQCIEQLGHEHTCRFILDFKDSFYTLLREKWPEHYRNVIGELKSADIAIFEVTVSSMTAGQLIQEAIHMSKPVIALHTGEYESIFLGGTEGVEPKVQVVEYSDENLEKVLKDAIEYAYDWLESRFTLILPTHVRRQLDQVAKSGTSRSEYIRKLIEKDMKKDSK
ncbi:MAG TPA: ribbon-helix-helix domain-containing protein [Patescibacteria group bacterium]|nr:ribbon-helix-helix domain-containing protein [Patescibacteria group bacterium]